MQKRNSMKFSIIKNSKIWLSFSSLLIVLSIVSLSTLGLNFGIDFTGGSLYEWDFGDSQITNDEIREVFTEYDIETQIQDSENGVKIIRSANITSEQHEEVSSALKEITSFDELRFESIGPVIGAELKRKSITAISILIVVIILYIAYAFRKVAEPVASWKYGVITIIAAAHDIIITLGLFALFGHILGYQIDTAFIAALLTILGYSINDTIVVFDRTRENLLQHSHVSHDEFEDIVDTSVKQTIARSINTSCTTLIVLLAVYFFGGDTTRNFILALMIGVTAGAYSSIFLASPLLTKVQVNK